MLKSFDKRFMEAMYWICIPLVRFSFFVVYFYFGFLKVLGRSPAEAVVMELWGHTMRFIPYQTFQALFGGYEMLIGLVFLIPGKERIALYLLIPHMITTFGPLVLLPKVAWRGFMVPTLTGHYIIKNLIIIALGIAVAANIGDFRTKRKMRKEANSKVNKQ